MAPSRETLDHLDSSSPLFKAAELEKVGVRRRVEDNLQANSVRFELGAMTTGQVRRSEKHVQSRRI